MNPGHCLCILAKKIKVAKNYIILQENNSISWRKDGETIRNGRIKKGNLLAWKDCEEVINNLPVMCSPKIILVFESWKFLVYSRQKVKIHKKLYTNGGKQFYIMEEKY